MHSSTSVCQSPPGPAPFSRSTANHRLKRRVLPPEGGVCVQAADRSSSPGHGGSRAPLCPGGKERGK
ncbi:hypothetical protein LDENG_00257810 [Lucifuga dentata]|nr:hypothetical protein LDENG_00257810 [Lucifuga dentata]